MKKKQMKKVILSLVVGSASLIISPNMVVKADQKISNQDFEKYQSTDEVREKIEETKKNIDEKNAEVEILGKSIQEKKNKESIQSENINKHIEEKKIEVDSNINDLELEKEKELGNRNNIENDLYIEKNNNKDIKSKLDDAKVDVENVYIDQKEEDAFKDLKSKENAKIEVKKNLDKELNDLENKKNNVEVKKEEINVSNDRLNEYKDKVDKYDKELIDVKSKYESNKKILEEYKKNIGAERPDQTQEFYNYKKNLKELEDYNNLYNIAKSEFEQVKKDLENKKNKIDIKSYEDRLSLSKEKLDKKEKEIGDVRQNIGKIESKIEICYDVLSKKESEADEYRLNKQEIINDLENKLKIAKENLEKAKNAENQGIEGFYNWIIETSMDMSEVEDAKKAIDVLRQYPDQIKPTEEGNATRLDNVKTSLEILLQINDLRRNDNNFPGLYDFVTDHIIQAKAISNAAHSYSFNNGHLHHFNVNENLAWGFYDPFRGWYDQEKAIYDEYYSKGLKPPYAKVGHYLNIIDGAATNVGLGQDYTPGKNDHDITHSMVSDYGNEAKRTFTIQEYLERFNQYLDIINIDKAIEEYNNASKNFELAKKDDALNKIENEINKIKEDIKVQNSLLEDLKDKLDRLNDDYKLLLESQQKAQKEFDEKNREKNADITKDEKYIKFKEVYDLSKYNLELKEQDAKKAKLDYDRILDFGDYNKIILNVENTKKIFVEKEQNNKLAKEDFKKEKSINDNLKLEFELLEDQIKGINKNVEIINQDFIKKSKEYDIAIENYKLFLDQREKYNETIKNYNEIKKAYESSNEKIQTLNEDIKNSSDRLIKLEESLEKAKLHRKNIENINKNGEKIEGFDYIYNKINDLSLLRQKIELEEKELEEKKKELSKLQESYDYLEKIYKMLTEQDEHEDSSEETKNPVINVIRENDTEISGKGLAGAKVKVLKNKEVIGDAVVKNNGTWKISGLFDVDFQKGDIIDIIQIKEGTELMGTPIKVIKNEKTDAEKNPVIVPEKIEVNDKKNLSEAEKEIIKDKIKDKNPAIKDIEVYNDGNVIITYQDGSSNKILVNKLISEKEAKVKNISDKIYTIIPKEKIGVKDFNNVTDEEKFNIAYSVKQANKNNFPEKTQVKVDDNGQVTIIYSDKSKYKIPSYKIVFQYDKGNPEIIEKPKLEITDIIDPKIPGKTVVKDKNNLTDNEKDNIENSVEKINKNDFPDGTKVIVRNDGGVIIKYPDGSTKIISSSNLIREKEKEKVKNLDINNKFTSRLSKSSKGNNVETGVGSVSRIVATLSAAVGGLFASKKRKNK